MQRILAALLLFAMITVAVLTAAPLFVNLDGYKEKLVSTIKSATGLEPVINGEVSVSFLPSLSVKVTNVTIPNIPGSLSTSLVKVESIYVSSSFKALFSGDIDIKNIELVRPVLELERLSDGRKNWDAITKAVSERVLPENFKFPELISIENGTVNYQEKDKLSTIDYISSDITSDSAIGPFAIYGEFSSGETVIDFEGYIGKLQDGAKASFDLKSKSFSLDMKGAYSGGEDSKISGSMNGNATNLHALIATLFDAGSIFAKVKSEENMALAGNFELSGKKLSFSEVKASSPSLEGNLGLDVIFGKTVADDLKWEVSIDMSKLDIDRLLVKEVLEDKDVKKEEVGEVIDYYASTLNSTGLDDFNFDFSSSLSGLFDIKIAEIKYHGDSISNIAIAADMLNGSANISSFSAYIPGGSVIELSGDITHNGIRPLLKGNIKSSGKSFRDVLSWLFPKIAFIPEGQMQEYLFESKINVTPQNINFRDMYLSVDKTLLTGEVSLRPQSTVPIVQAHVTLDRLDMDQYGFTDKIYSHADSFFSGLAERSLMTSWLRMLSLRYELSLDVKDFIFNKNKVDIGTVVLNVSQGTFDLQKLSLNSDKALLDGNMIISLMGGRPTIDVAMKAKKLDTSAFIPAHAKKDNAEAIANPQWIWSKEPFNFGGIDRFHSRVNIAFDKFMHDGISLENVVLQGISQKKVFRISRAEARIFGGKAVVKGSVGIDESHPSIGVSLLLNNVDLKSLAGLLIDGSDIDGKFFFSGVIKTIGESPSDWMLGLDAKGKVAGRYVTFKNFDLDHIITNSRSLYSVIDMNNIVKKAMSSGKTTFDSIDGSISTSKGILTAKDFDIVTKTSKGLFAGNVSLGNFMMKGLAKFGYRPEKTKGVALKLSMDGSISDLTRKMDTSELEKYIVAKGRR